MLKGKELLRAAGCEFIASLFFVFFGAGSVTAPGGSAGNTTTAYAIAFGFSITVLAFSIGDVSGGHINPAVTLSMMVTRHISVMQGGVYMVAQFLGAISGGGLLSACVPAEQYNSGIGMSPAVKPEGAFLLEFMGTFFLLFVIYNVAVWSSGLERSDVAGSVVSGLSPIPIGFTIVVCHLVLGPLTGCGINPSRVVGAVIFQKGFFETWAGENFWVYFAGPFTASFVAPLSFYLMYPGSVVVHDAKKEVQPTIASNQDQITHLQKEVQPTSASN